MGIYSALVSQNLPVALFASRGEKYRYEDIPLPVQGMKFQRMDPIVELLMSYRELNGSTITELDTEPSALEYMRFVALNTPFVVRGAVSQWRATTLWNCSYLKEVMRNQQVKVAVTPKGFEKKVFVQLV
jgi:hypothetical protein